MATYGVVPAREYNTALTVISIVVGVTVVVVGPRFSSKPASDTIWAIITAAIYATVTMVILRYSKSPLPGRVERVADSDLPPPAPLVSALICPAAVFALTYALVVGFYLANAHSASLLGICLGNAVVPYHTRRRFQQVEHDNQARAYVTTHITWTPSQNHNRILWLVPYSPGA